MALTPASILADYTSGIGTQGATLKINTSDKRIGIGTTNPQGTLQVGTGITMGSGIITATSFDANTASFSGNVSVGGVLTYEDVTSVDSVGIITAQQGIRVGAGQSIGSDGALTYYGDGFNLTGIDATAIKDSAGGTVRVQANTSGAVVTGILTVTTLEQTQTYPTIRPTLDLNFAATKTLDRRITFTRDGVGTYTDDMGIIRYASNNVPRFDHDVSTGESLGLLIEEGRTNLTTYSSEMNLWTNGSTTISENVVTSPDGTLTADKVALNSGGAYIARSLTISANSVHTYSVYMKRAENNFGMLRYRWDGTTYDTVNFDLVNGTTTRTPSGVSSTSIIDVGNDWYRCIVTFTPTSTVSSNFQIRSSSEAQTSSSSPYTGTFNGTNGAYFWGAQVEQGAFASSYIPTTGSAVTRGSDQAKITGTNFTDFYNQTEGTVFSSHQQYSGLSDTQNTYVYQIATNNSTSVAFRLIDKNTFYGSPARLSATQWANDVLMQKPDATNGERIKTAFACKVNDAAVSYDGATVLTDTSLDMNSGQTNMSIGMYPTSPQGFLNGHVQQISYYNKRLPNAQLQGLTA